MALMRSMPVRNTRISAEVAVARVRLERSRTADAKAYACKYLGGNFRDLILERSSL